MFDPEFDDYVMDYEQQHRESIRVTGEDPEYFSDYKIRDLKRLVGKWGLENPTILDFGSGMGNSIPGFRTYFPENSVACADVSSKSLAAAHDRHGGNEPQLLISENRLPAPDASFDIAFTACVFHHIPQDEHLHWLCELRRVTRPGGHIVIFEHNPLNPLTQRAVRKCAFDVNAVLISAHEMKRRLRKAGWTTPRADFHIFFPHVLARLRPIESLLRWCPAGGQYACHAITLSAP